MYDPFQNCDLILQDQRIYPPTVQRMLKGIGAVGPRKSLVQQLQKRGVQAEEIDSVLFRYDTTVGGLRYA